MEMSDIIKGTDPRGIKINCSHKHFEEHIIECSGHTIMRENVDSVKRTIENPDRIFQDKDHHDRDIYFKADKDATYYCYGQQTKVVVAIGGGYGEIVTTYNVKQSKYPGTIGEAKYNAKL